MRTELRRRGIFELSNFAEDLDLLVHLVEDLLLGVLLQGLLALEGLLPGLEAHAWPTR